MTRLGAPCAPRPHTASWQYVQGTPTQVTSSRGPWAEYEYHPNLTFARIGHNTGAEDVYNPDPHGLPRPRRIHIKRGNTTLYDTGPYQYDGAGNIWSIGSDPERDFYYYDQAGRLIEGGLTRFGPSRKELYSYDAFDNLLSLNRVSDPAALQWNVDAKNRVRGPLNATPDIFYDPAGNVLSVAKHTNGTPVFQFTYDALNMQSGFHRTNPDGTTAEDYLYVYGPGNYRFLVFRTDGANANRTITLRGLDSKPLTRFIVTGFGAGAQWNWDQDSLHGANGIFAAIRSDGNTYHYHPDHLGSPRILTNQTGAYLSERHYYPYGTEYVRFEGRPDDISAKFTGHERDPNGLTDYMLGRTYVYPLGRFASVDPARDGWNLYGYVGGNPIGFIDPTGLDRKAFLLTTGSFTDPARHSALYISETGSLDNSGTVYSLGGRTNGVATLSEYLSIQESNDEPTLAFQLDLDSDQVDELEVGLQEDFIRASSGDFVTPQYEPFTNNCTQYCYRSVMGAAEPSGLSKLLGLLTRLVEGTPVFTNQTLAILSGYGIINFFSGEAVTTDQIKQQAKDTQETDQ